VNQSTRERRGGVKSLSLKNDVNLKDLAPYFFLDIKDNAANILR
jgi:hypothetical protein